MMKQRKENGPCATGGGIVKVDPRFVIFNRHKDMTSIEIDRCGQAHPVRQGGSINRAQIEGLLLILGAIVELVEVDGSRDVK